MTVPFSICWIVCLSERISILRRALERRPFEPRYLSKKLMHCPQEALDIGRAKVIPAVRIVQPKLIAGI